MVKKLLLIIVLLGVLFVFREVVKQFRNTDTILGRISGLINRDNYLEVKTNTLDLNKIEILWQKEYNDPKIIFQNAIPKEKIGYQYGHNMFTVKYEQNEISEVGHFKTNNWHTHKYLFILDKEQSNYVLKFTADGPDEYLKNDTIWSKNNN